MDTSKVITALSALAQESRLAVYRALVQAGPEGLAASRIAELIGTSPSSLSFHLKEMSHAGLLISRQDGRFIIYSANYDAMNALIGFLTENCCGGNPCGPGSQLLGEALAGSTAEITCPPSAAQATADVTATDLAGGTDRCC